MLTFDSFLAVANETMCRPIRTLTEAKGHDTSQHNLASFGGAGGQHAASIAAILGIKRVLIHKYSSLLSAYGMALADHSHEEQMPSSLVYSDSLLPKLSEDFEVLEAKAVQKLVEQHVSPARISSERYLNMRYNGSDNAIMVQLGSKDDSFLSSFITAHHKQFGFTPENSDVIIDDIRVRSTGHSAMDFSGFSAEEVSNLKIRAPTPFEEKKVYFGGLGWTKTPVYQLADVQKGSKIVGPALLIDATQTILVVPGCVATMLSDVIVMDMNSTRKKSLSTSEIDPIQLTIFGHRFMGIAEQMGRVLQKTSISANIKERLDFTCAVFAPDGSLVANAPHVPAMIGSMAYAVKWQIEYWKGQLHPGDVILSNSPICGGVHLPDMTTITPVFDADGKDIIFWTASRGHHADVGGILPGSMPPNSREIWEEGAVFEAFKVVEQGIFNETELIERLLEPAKYPGCSGTRCLKDNVSDIRAQIAANHRGSQLIDSLIQDYSLDVVQLCMGEIQGIAELAVRNLLKDIAKQRGQSFGGVDYMDDGTQIKLSVSINEETGAAKFDFTGTGREVYGKCATAIEASINADAMLLGNWNAPIAITHSAILFSLRCMVGTDIPINQGAIKPIEVIVPDRSLLRPGPRAACCAGNVLTSQRIVDTIFRAFGVMAASQGCMFPDHCRYLCPKTNLSTCRHEQLLLWL